MRIYAKVRAGAKENSVRRRENMLIIRVTAPAEKGRANKKVAQLLAEYFQVPRWRVKIVAGLSTPVKLIEIVDFDPKDVFDVV